MRISDWSSDVCSSDLQLMEIAGVDYPERPERFEVCYHLLSLTKNRRIRVRVSTDEDTPVPSLTGIWPVANWLEREVYDMYGVLFANHPDLRRILTDHVFQGHHSGRAPGRERGVHAGMITGGA